MGTSKSYIPKVNRETTALKKAIGSLVGGGFSQGKIHSVVQKFSKTLKSEKSYVSSIVRLSSSIFNALEQTKNGEIENIEFKDTNEMVEFLFQSPEKFSFLGQVVMDALNDSLNRLDICDFEDLKDIDISLFTREFLGNILRLTFISRYYEIALNKSLDAADIVESIGDYIRDLILNAKIEFNLNDEEAIERLFEQHLNEAIDLMESIINDI